ncbi:MAG: hypothetical protein M1825_005270 [Sarcosagium campestre]|nr:MAG: hypothetical protein M1825_005270 [Sarcosagium campestre]
MFGRLSKRATEGVQAGALALDPVNYTLLAAFTAVAWCYAFELNLKVILTFKRRRGLYFWSLLICSWGITLHALAFVLKFYVGDINWVFSCIIITIGWYAMVTGQAFVLYSRLHLVVRNLKILRGVLCMILVNILILHLPTTIFTFGSNSPSGPAWAQRFDIMERIQLAGFCVQELIISTIYVSATLKLLRSIYHSMTRRVMAQLVIINLICIGLDIVLIILQYTGNYVAQASSKPFIYAVKLKLEFAVLNQLMVLANTGLTEGKRRTGQGSENRDNPQRSATQNMLQSMDGSEGRRDIGTWSFAKAGRKNSAAQQEKRSPERNGISKTQHIEVSTEINVDGAAKKRHGDGTARELSAVGKSSSLMGTTVVSSPSRAGNRSPGPGLDTAAARRHSPTESETEFITHASDSKESSTRSPTEKSESTIGGVRTVQVSDYEILEAPAPSVVRNERNSVHDFGPGGDLWEMNPYRKAKKDSEGPFHQA